MNVDRAVVFVLSQLIENAKDKVELLVNNYDYSTVTKQLLTQCLSDADIVVSFQAESALNNLDSIVQESLMTSIEQRPLVVKIT